MVSIGDLTSILVRNHVRLVVDRVRDGAVGVSEGDADNDAIAWRRARLRGPFFCHDVYIYSRQCLQTVVVMPRSRHLGGSRRAAVECGSRFFLLSGSAKSYLSYRPLYMAPLRCPSFPPRVYLLSSRDPCFVS